MFDVAISELTTPRWELRQELAHASEHGFAAVSLWRPKLTDVGVEQAAAGLIRAGMQVSSLQWAGGFTGSDGRSFRESVSDAEEAIETASRLASSVGQARPPALVIHGGCRGGHTRSHASRLVHEALASLLPVAAREGVPLAVKPVHPCAAPGCGVLNDLRTTLELVESLDSRLVGISLDLWNFGERLAAPRDGFDLLPRLAAAAAIVQVADRCGSPSLDADRLPAGTGCLPLETAVASLWEQGYRGVFEFDPVGEAVEMLGYPGTWHDTRLVVDAWTDALVSRLADLPQPLSQPATVQDAVVGPIDTGYPSGPLAPSRSAHLRTTAGSLRSHASSQIVSRG